MRILTFTSLFPNKMQPNNCIFIHRRMSHFARRPGNEVVVVAPVPYFPEWFRVSSWHSYSQIPRQERIDNLETYHPRYPLIPKVAMSLHGYLMFVGSRELALRLHRDRPFDFIDAHYVFPDGFAAVLLGKMLGLPVIVSARGTDMNLFPSFRTIRPMIDWTLKRVAGGIGVCSPLKDLMVAHGLAPDKVQVIGNGVETDLFHAVEPSVARSHLQISRTGKVIVSVGGLVERKGLHFLIPAVAQILPRNPDLQLYIIGGGPAKHQLEMLVRKYNLQDRVFLKGPQANAELKYWYSAADVSALTSSREGWPNVILESMACGTPVVATGVFGVPEVIVSPELGITVEQTVPSIANGLNAALSKDWDRRVIAQHARQRTWEVVAQELEGYFEQRLGSLQFQTTAGFATSST
jgi:glycosyltransferase involved in cell wall biosynthesis